MFATYLRRELSNRRRQSIIIASGMGLAIALVIVVNAVSAGVTSAQNRVLQSVYGIGTDITVSLAAAPPQAGDTGGQGFEFGAEEGTTANGTQSVSRTRLTPARGTSTFPSTALGAVNSVNGVAAATGVLALNNTTFNGQLPGRAPGQAPAPEPTAGAARGGGAFNVNSFTVLGIDPAGTVVGPLTAATLSQGRTLTTSDATANVAVLDSAYATSAQLTLGATLAIAGTPFQVIGIVASTAADGSSAANVYIPLTVAQQLASLPDQLTSVYVRADSASNIGRIQTDLQTALPNNAVKTQADLASSVSGSLSTASQLVTNLGTWLSLIVLAAAFLIAILFTISGVSRRTREFGTLKALGWSNRRVVGQVAGESLVQGALGGALGVALGLLGIFVVNLAAPSLSAGTRAASAAGHGGGFGQQAAAATATNVTLALPITLAVIGLAVGLAALGGLLAGAFGGWRAARLRPAEAFRSVA